MKTKVIRIVIAVCCVLVLNAVSALADGLMVVETPQHQQFGLQISRVEALPVKYHRVKVSIDNGVAVTSVDQVFKNEYDTDLEGTYMFPIPEDAAITDFSMYVDGKKVSAEVLDKETARRTYEEIVRRMKDPGLMEYAGRNMFRTRVYPVPAHGEKRIEITYQQTISYENGLYTYSYPLDTERFSPKPLEEVTISTRIRSQLPIKNVYSPSHEVKTVLGEREATASYEANNVLPDKNFLLHYMVSDKGLGLNLLTCRKPNEDGYFIMFISPGQLEQKAASKDIVFVLDNSGSMGGRKIQQAKDALRYCLNNLNEGDRFNLITFNSTVDDYRNSLVPANQENIQEALRYVDRISVGGGTNINQALLSALKDFSGESRPRMVVFLTDGEPTEGTTDIKEILRNVTDNNEHRTRIFVFGVGHDVNTLFLDRISEVNRGASQYVGPSESIESAVTAFYRKVREPVMSDLKLDFGSKKVKDVYPVDLPDIFNGGQLIVLGRYSDSGHARIVLKGTIEGKEKYFVYEGNFSAENSGNDFIPRLWAMRTIGHLLSEIRFKQENKELVDEIVRLSKEFGIITPYTSFFIGEQEKHTAGPRMYTPRFLDQSVAPGVLGLKQDAVTLDISAIDKGEESIAASRHIVALQNQMHETDSISATHSGQVKHIADKSFYLGTDDYWVDFKFKEGMKITEVKYLSSGYFELLKKNPRLAKYLSAAKRMIVVSGDTAYRIVE